MRSRRLNRPLLQSPPPLARPAQDTVPSSARWLQLGRVLPLARQETKIAHATNQAAAKTHARGNRWSMNAKGRNGSIPGSNVNSKIGRASCRERVSQYV